MRSQRQANAVTQDRSTSVLILPSRSSDAAAWMLPVSGEDLIWEGATALQGAGRSPAEFGGGPGRTADNGIDEDPTSWCASSNKSLHKWLRLNEAVVPSRITRVARPSLRGQAEMTLRSWSPQRPDDYAVVVRDVTGQQVVDAGFPWGSSVPKGANLPIDQQVIATKEPVI